MLECINSYTQWFKADFFSSLCYMVFQHFGFRHGAGYKSGTLKFYRLSFRLCLAHLSCGCMRKVSMPLILYSENISVWYPLLLSVSTNWAKTTLVEDIKLVNLWSIVRPGFWSIQKIGEYDGQVDCNLCLKLNAIFIPKTMVEFPMFVAKWPDAKS